MKNFPLLEPGISQLPQPSFFLVTVSSVCEMLCSSKGFEGERKAETVPTLVPLRSAALQSQKRCRSDGRVCSWCELRQDDTLSVGRARRGGGCGTQHHPCRADWWLTFSLLSSSSNFSA